MGLNLYYGTSPQNDWIIITEWCAILFSASTTFSKSLFNMSDFWSSMKMVLKEFCFKKRISMERIFFICVLWAAMLTGIPVLKKIQNMPGIVAMTKVVWKPGNSFFERKHGGNWRKLTGKSCFPGICPAWKKKLFLSKCPEMVTQRNKQTQKSQQ